ncbi:hypothetical protein KHA94_13435 [Bacillus sp. FJAT-49705]|uniref:BppU N-terminal domain-containing protein n=1 Tax=Cytobacillus citreus TaxID=2833586 RepID=A0ABS5NTN4_9BACI|nr:hypothetical protein [Cytobacillus citreus]MBS4191186.1 hypothetical protein [Cytobacillus citreus]
METLTKRSIVIDLKQVNMLPTPQFIQQDSNILEFVVLDNGVDANLENIGKIIVNYKRPDGKVISRLLTAEGNKVVYEIGQAEMEVHGEGLLEIQFYSLDILQRISSRTFKIILSQSIGTTGISEDDKNITILQQLMIEVTELNTQITTAETVRENAEAIRQSQETVRESNEDARKLAEDTRILAENERQTNISTALTDIENAILSANTASINAENQANHAKTQGDYANEQAIYTKEVGDIALNNATDALLAADSANQSATNAQSLVNSSKHLGEYSSTTNYITNNEVRYNGSTWRCMQDCIGVTPVEGVNWTLVAQRGIDGQGAVSTVSGKSPDLNGDVQLNASDVGAIPSSDIGKTVAGFNESGQVLDKHGNVVEGKVKSVNGQTGEVNITNVDSADDAAKLGGNLPSHYATAQSVTDVDNKIGVLNELSTTEKENIVSAINEIKQTTNERFEGVDTLLLDKANITHQHSISDIMNLQTTLDEKAETSQIGDLTTLTTTEKEDIVKALNEVNAKPSGGGSNDEWKLLNTIELSPTSPFISFNQRFQNEFSKLKFVMKNVSMDSSCTASMSYVL